MPLVNGLQVCKKIREKDRHTKIILLTSRVDKQTLMDAVELGLTSYLDKPATKERIIEALNKLLDYNQSVDALLWREGTQEYLWYCSKRELFFEQEAIHLTKNEKALLELLITTKHKNLNYQQISDALYSPDSDKVLSDAAIKTLMCGLRSKLPANTIKNEYGLGYFFDRDISKN
jgi:DNA-binding response OmpR family regulator